MATQDPVLELAHSMIAGTSRTVNTIDAGYTYFGQFISHELVPQTTPETGSTRIASPYLDLDSLYGSAGQTGTFLDATGRFEIRPAAAGGPLDLPRTAGIARIPEQCDRRVSRDRYRHHSAEDAAARRPAARA